MRRLAHPGRAAAYLVLTVAIAAAAFVLGTLVRSPDASVLDARRESIPVYAAAESRVVSADVRIQGEALGAATQTVNVAPPEGASLAVVTAVGAQAGAALSNGTLLGTVSDRPVFVIAVQIPLYRDLRRGDVGSDVVSLQAALRLDQSGEVDSRTLQAIRDLYAGADVEPPGGAGYNTYIKMSEFYTAPATGSLQLVSIAPVGSQLTPDVPFAVIGVGAPYISVRASVSELEQIAVGDSVRLQRSTGAEAAGVVASIGPFQASATDTGAPPGRDVRIDVPEDAALTVGEPVSVVFGAIQEPSLAVPTLAIRSDVNGDYVLEEREDDVPVRVSVQVLRNAQGWTAIDAADIAVGDRVLVSG